MNPAEIYDSYFVPAMFLPSTMELVALAKPVTGDRVLDIACGSGIVVRTLAPIVGASNVVGIDLSPAMLAVARAASPELDLREGTALALPVPDAAFDLVTCQHGLQFMPDRALAAKEMRRALAPNGRAVVACWAGLDRLPLWEAMFTSAAEYLGVPVARLAMPSSASRDDLHGAMASAFGSVEIVERTVKARFASADRFLELSMRGASATVPQFAGGDIAVLVAKVQRDIAPLVERHRQGDDIVADMPMHVAVARS
jgi:SAM-dependent methyltransferase